MALINPHDTFFESVFSEKENAIGHLEAVLPPSLKKNINLNSIKIEKKSYLDDELKKYYSDIIYSGYYKEHCLKLTFLYEHKSYAVKFPHFQLLRYMLNIWDMSIKQKEKLSVVIPIIVYHGTEEWKVTPLSGYFDGIDENLMPFIPNFSYILSNLSMYSNEDIKNDDEHKKRIEQVLEKQGVEVMTILEDIELKAEIRGKIKDKQEILIRLLSKKFRLSGEEISYIKTIENVNKLDSALDEILFVEAKAGIFDLLK